MDCLCPCIKELARMPLAAQFILYLGAVKNEYIKMAGNSYYNRSLNQRLTHTLEYEKSH